jgi:plastocyanin
MRISSRRLLATASVVAMTGAATLGLAACGGSSGGGGSAGEPCPANVDATVKTASADLRFQPDTLSVKAGKVVIRLIEGSSLPHSFEIHGISGKIAVDGSTKERCATFDLVKGTYKFFCGVSGHEAAGMKGTLTVS